MQGRQVIKDGAFALGLSPAEVPRSGADALSADHAVWLNGDMQVGGECCHISALLHQAHTTPET